ncbi:SMP-30/gluconolactonase/LRE family protein [Yinghuangia sp. ASG 101]|uniref:SMP-30/gluconolactonase/LRE family protein n=1 Tax=Yinghuangia sp. ASG 101 TaxID=2896848 RepID=UPI001E429970|nr:SMP-30/gluconolactonase/LRE family protein [Yinghuangia sp. ASG 101]UGQ11660.1 SMP-30/gluconolactonase/LRE family protein [Yinghuangia sp. ASG 101]
MEIRILTETKLAMGEGPLWDVDAERLYWIDVFEAVVHRCALDGSESRSWRFPGHSLSALGLCKDGGTIVTSGAAIHRFDLDSGEADLVFDPGLGTGYGFNDGTVDRQGRFITGMADGKLIAAITSGRTEGLVPTGNIYRVDTDLSVHVIGDPIGVTNGPCLDAAGTTFFCNDSGLRRMYAWDYDPATGEATNRRTVAEFTGGAIPDGTTVDDQGHLWTAAYHGGEVRRYAPDGTLERTIPVPAVSPTSVAFAGPNLDVLVVTSRGGDDAEGDGRILTLHGLGARGVPESKFG